MMLTRTVLVLSSLLLVLLSFAVPSRLEAALTLQLGPASTGGGGPNPISIPPTNLLDYELVWETKNHSEISVSVFPGLFYGHRIRANNGTYLSLGGGLVINLHGIGPGVYSAFGYQVCSSVCFNVEYKQAIGVAGARLINPYAVRIGITFFPGT